VQVVDLSGQSQQVVHRKCESRHEVIVYLRSQESIEITEAPETVPLT
jgi:hypothetical protein